MATRAGSAVCPRRHGKAPLSNVSHHRRRHQRASTVTGTNVSAATNPANGLNSIEDALGVQIFPQERTGRFSLQLRAF
jgi:hypothetical protein